MHPLGKTHWVNPDSWNSLEVKNKASYNVNKRSWCARHFLVLQPKVYANTSTVIWFNKPVFFFFSWKSSFWHKQSFTTNIFILSIQLSLNTVNYNSFVVWWFCMKEFDKMSKKIMKTVSSDEKSAYVKVS